MPLVELAGTSKPAFADPYFLRQHFRAVADGGGGAVGDRCLMRRQLTPREQEVVVLLAYGHTNAEVASRLTVSVRTAELHRANAMRKLATRSRADLVRWALDHDLLR